MTIELRILDERIKQWGTPVPATPGSAGHDLFACLAGALMLEPGDEYLIKTGIAIHIGSNTVAPTAGLILPRSGLGRKGLVLGNTIGLIDSDYQGEIMVSVWNRSRSACIRVEPGDRIAQLVFVPVLTPGFTVVEAFSPSARGAGGFGSTGG